MESITKKKLVIIAIGIIVILTVSIYLLWRFFPLQKIAEKTGLSIRLPTKQTQPPETTPPPEEQVPTEETYIGNEAELPELAGELATDEDRLFVRTPYYTEHFGVKFNEQEKIFEITLYAIYNHPWQKEQYYQQLKEYKQEFSDWLSIEGINPQNLKIKYLPEEAENL